MRTHIYIFLLLLFMGIPFPFSCLAYQASLVGATSQTRIYNDSMQKKDIQIRSLYRREPGPSCGALSRSIKELEKGIPMLGGMLAQVKQELKDLQRELKLNIADYSLIKRKIATRLYWYEDWQILLGQFKRDLDALKQKATQKGCSQKLINPCQVQSGRIRCR